MEKQLEAYLYEQIPITKAMGIKVEEASTHQVILFAPLSPNVNHKKTVFGGSLHAVATLTCWSLLYINLKEKLDEHTQVVITKSDISYRAPVDADFRAECVMPEEASWQRFMKMLQLKGKARIGLCAKIYQRNQLCVDYQAIFAVIKVKEQL